MGTGSQCAISNGTLVPVPCVSYYVQSVQDYENRLAEKNNQRPDPEEQVLIF